MNFQYNKLISRLRRIRRELNEMSESIEDELKRGAVKRSIEINKIRNRLKDAILHLDVAIPINDNTPENQTNE